jgi:hypothetical protein
MRESPNWFEAFDLPEGLSTLQVPDVDRKFLLIIWY